MMIVVLNLEKDQITRTDNEKLNIVRMISLINFQMSGYSKWNPSYPKSFTSNIGVVEQQFSSDLTVGWQNINAYSVAEYYMCEVASCDTDKYC